MSENDIHKFSLILKQLRKRSNMSQNDVAVMLGIGRTTYTGYERGNIIPPSDKLQKLAEIFHVTTDFLLGRQNYMQCQTCYYMYDPTNDIELYEHEEFHDKFTKAQAKFGEILLYGDAQEKRSDSISALKNPSLPIEKRIVAFDDYLKYSFMIDIYNKKFSLDHEEFAEFAEKEAQSLQSDHLISEELCDKIRKKYGVGPESKVVQLNTRDERDIKKDLDSLMKKLTNNEYGPAAFDGEDIPEDDKELFAGQLELMLRRLKTINKEKYNPHKNKK